MRRVAKSGYLPYLTRTRIASPVPASQPRLCVCVCACCRIPASHVRSVVSRTRFELHLIWLWVWVE